MAEIKTDVSLTMFLEGQVYYPSGATFNYGIDSIPYVAVDLVLDDQLKFICNLEEYRRKAVVIELKSTKGCLKFDGVIDGLSFYQNFGNIQAQLIVKSQLQVLLECFPRLPGLHPTTTSIFRRYDGIKLNLNSPSSETASVSSVQIANLVLNTSLQVPHFIVHAAQKYVETQSNIETYANVNVNVSAVLEYLRSVGVKEQLQRASNYIGKIDVSPLNNYTYKAGGTTTYNAVLAELAESTTSIFEFLVEALHNAGCAMVLTDTGGFVVPDTGFLKIEGARRVEPSVKAISSFTNIAYPSQYDSISFNDNGYRDLAACILTRDPSVPPPNNDTVYDMGYYQDKKMKRGGVLITGLPKYSTASLDFSHAEYTKEIQKAIKEQKPNLSKDIEPGAVPENNKGAYYAQVERIQRNYYNDLAQLKFLQAKYLDRNGSVDMLFNPKWAPGAVGAVYTRLPGVWLDFFVTGVTHKFQISQNAASAKTTVFFNSGRLGKVPVGLEFLPIYNFGTEDSFKFADKFVVEIEK